MGLLVGYSGGSAATHLMRELVTCAIETENDGTGVLLLLLLRIGFRRVRIGFRRRRWIFRRCCNWDPGVASTGRHLVDNESSGDVNGTLDSRALQLIHQPRCALGRPTQARHEQQMRVGHDAVQGSNGGRECVDSSH